jgi:hypothetical protein
LQLEQARSWGQILALDMSKSALALVIIVKLYDTIRVNSIT